MQQEYGDHYEGFSLQTNFRVLVLFRFGVYDFRAQKNVQDIFWLGSGLRGWCSQSKVFWLRIWDLVRFLRTERNSLRLNSYARFTI